MGSLPMEREGNMKQLTVRGVNDDLHSALKKEADRRGTSMNRVVLALLKEAVGVSNGNGRYQTVFDDLDHLAGTWSRKEAEVFEQSLKQQRTIDEKLWQ
jgi:plasmid stability protein